MVFSIASPMDSHADVVPFEKASKIKAVGGEILKVSVYEPLTKAILIEAMGQDVPVPVYDSALLAYTVTGFSMKQGGKIVVDLDDNTSVPIDTLYLLDRTMSFGK